MKIAGIIPARYASTRFPGKPLADIMGTTMIMRVVQQATKCKALCCVVVATDDQRIYDHVKEHNGEVIMTSKNHSSGTARCEEVLGKLQKKQAIDAVINIQGDEPFIDPGQIEQVARLLQHSEQVSIATLIKKTDKKEELFDPNTVKVVTDASGKALYFSRAPIPWHRDEKSTVQAWTHVGIYGYRSEVLQKITALSPAPEEEREKLEQLRWLYHGFQIHTAVTTYESKGIDTPDDLLKLINND